MDRLTIKERQRLVREEAILEAAHELLLEQGYGAMSMDDLVARVGISKATLYQHFASKEELAIQIVLRAMRRGDAEFQALDSTRPAIDRLEHLYVRALNRKADLAAAQISLLPHSLHHHPAYQEQLARSNARFTALIDEAKAAGDIDANLSTPVLVRTLSRMFQIDYADLMSAGYTSQAEMVETLRRLLFDGLRTRKESPQ